MPVPYIPGTRTFSAIDTAELCLRQYYHKYVSKDYEEGPKPWLAEGNAIHSALECRVRDGVALPEKYAKYEPVANVFCVNKGATKYVEHKLAVDKALNPIPYDSDDRWLRGKIDLLAVKDNLALVVDWKTGKVKKDFFQLKLMTLLTFINFPNVKSIQAGYVWLKFSKWWQGTNYTRKDLPFIIDEFQEREFLITAAENSNQWPATKNKWCRHCAVKICPDRDGIDILDETAIPDSISNV